MLVVAAEKLQAKQVVAGNETLDLVEDGPGIEGGELGLEVVGGEPDGVTVGLAGLRAAALAEVGAETFGYSFPKGTSVLMSAPILSAMRTIISKSERTPARSAAFWTSWRSP